MNSRVLRYGRALCGVLVVGAPAQAQGTADSTIVMGRLVGADGKVPMRADVLIASSRDPRRSATVQADSAGMFRVAVAGAGPFRIRLSAVGLLPLERALPTAAPTSITISATLPGYPEGLAKGPIVGVASEADAEKPRPDAPPMVLLAPDASGRRAGVLRAKRDTLVYRVIDFTARVFLPPVGAPAFRLAQDGQYEGVLRTTPGADAPLTFDLSGLVIGGEGSLRVLDGHPIAPVVAQLDSLLSAPPQRRCLLDAPAAPLPRNEATLRDSTLAAQLQLIRKLLDVDARCETQQQLGTAVAALFTPRSPLWELDDVMRQRVLPIASRHATGQARYASPAATALVRERFDAAIDTAPSGQLRRDRLIAAAESFMPADTVTAQRYAAAFVQDGADDPRLPALLRLTGYNRMLQPGRKVPAFRMTAMNSARSVLSDESLRGSVYLLDVWATWCQDCIVELPALTELHTRYGRRGLRVISVSVDAEQSTVERFRRTRNPMPWTHAWVGVDEANTGPLAPFEVVWLPTTILVGKDGTILSLAPKLASAEFRAVIERALR